MKRHWSARLLSASLALWFGLAMVGAQAHQCPVHDGPVAATLAHSAGHASHGAPSQENHQHCSCPQACCPAGVGLALPTVAARWAATPASITTTTPTAPRVVLPRAARHLLPFALAPPPALLV